MHILSWLEVIYKLDVNLFEWAVVNAGGNKLAVSCVSSPFPEDF